MGNGFQDGKVAGKDVLLPGCLYNEGFVIFFITGLASVGVIDIFPDNGPRRDDLQCPNHFRANFYHGISAFREYQFLSHQAVRHLLGGQSI